MDVVRLEKRDRARAATALTEAFHADPVYERLIPDPEARTAALQRLWRAIVRYGLLYGQVYTTHELDGIASWLPPGETDGSVARAVRAGMPFALNSFPSEARRTFLAVLEVLDPLQRQLMPEPHWYLAVLGVRPERQGRGIGSALMAPVLDRADATGVPCYLEAITEANVAFYTGRGFEVIKEGEVPHEGIDYWVMARRPSEGRG
jgi:ribosomal protein S18 acetylase RimI-like enzyme